jgi:hypothetical protein
VIFLAVPPKTLFSLIVQIINGLHILSEPRRNAAFSISDKPLSYNPHQIGRGKLRERMTAIIKRVANFERTKSSRFW